MRLNNFISINQEDMSPLHEQLTSIYDGFMAGAKDAHEAESFEKMFKQEYPHLIRLKDLIESVLIEQNNLRNFERIKDPKAKKESRIVKLKIFRKKDPPDEPA